MRTSKSFITQLCSFSEKVQVTPALAASWCGTTFPQCCYMEAFKAKTQGWGPLRVPKPILPLPVNSEVALVGNDSVTCQQWKAHAQIRQETRTEEESHAIAANYASDDKSEKDLR